MVMSVWFAIPSKRSPYEAEPVLKLWRELGYKIALLTDDQETRNVHLQIVSVRYEGYSKSVNCLVERILGGDPEASWIVSGGDDVEPDTCHTAEEIASQCAGHFAGTFGVMQPTGDRWADGSIDRICGSPWMGRDFCRRMNGGNGPFWPEYWHMFPDEEMQEVAKLLGILWQRRDLVHRHNHFCRVGEAVDWAKGRANMPAFLQEANSAAHWQKYKDLFQSRKNAGFPGHEPVST
jgi:hypothetical protein